MNFKHCLLLVVLFMVGIKQDFAQTYKTDSGKVPLSFKMIIGDIKAITNKAKSTLQVKTKQVRVSIPIKSFVFENPFVEAQFKNSYMEQEKYPETIFEGVLQKKINFRSTKTQEISAKGFLTMHGVKKPRVIPAKIVVSGHGKKIQVISKFKVKASEHKINVPASAFQNGDDSIEITLNAEYFLYK